MVLARSGPHGRESARIVRDKTIPKLTDEQGYRLTCQHFVVGHGQCITCKSRDVAMGCTRSAVYPDRKCFEHTVWLEGAYRARSDMDNISGRTLQETARYKAWTAFNKQTKDSG